ncbi:MAG TPA: hypothetical protein VMF62_17340 [Acetobacteraceae bacterium]|jgi:hypothetical protein|nr:hypothetical protein [Acetobacteraceae bacterium]
MATLIDSAEYTPNEIYEIQQTDKVEGAASGASFSGIGVSNEPHQQLANRTAFLYGRQNTNIGNITTLQGQVAALLARNTWTNAATFAAPGSYEWSVPPGVSVVRAIVVGGGGGGSDCLASNLEGYASGGGGGAGGYAEGFVTVAGGAAMPVTVGSGGGPQSTGGTSAFGGLVAYGGGGSLFQRAGSSAGAGGGAASGGFMALSGGDGSDGQSGLFVFPGNGAPGPWGGGGRAGAQGGTPGAGPGAGGGGAYDPLFTGNYYYGGAGASGIVIILW